MIVCPSAEGDPTQCVTYSPRRPLSVMIATAYLVSRVVAPFLQPSAPIPPPPDAPRFCASNWKTWSSTLIILLISLPLVCRSVSTAGGILSAPRFRCHPRGRIADGKDEP